MAAVWRRGQSRMAAKRARPLLLLAFPCLIYLIFFGILSPRPGYSRPGYSFDDPHAASAQIWIDCAAAERLPLIHGLARNRSWSEVFKSFYNGAQVVVKVIRTHPREGRQATPESHVRLPEFVPQAAQRSCNESVYISNEARIAKMFIGNPRVVQLVGYCRATSKIVYEYYPQTLLGLVFNKEVVPDTAWNMKIILKLCLGVAAAVEELHGAAGGPVTHAEINPGQFMIDSDGGVRIGDFHHSTHPEVGLIDACDGMVGGRFIAPEQIGRKAQNTSTDIYAVGLMIWTIANREYPFDKVDKVELWKLLTEDQIRPTIPKTMHEDLANLARECWKQDMYMRPPARAVRIELEQLVEKLS